MFIRINPDAEEYKIFKEINKIHRHIKKSLIDNIWKRLLELKFKSNNSIITKALKRAVKKNTSHIVKNEKQITKNKTNKSWETFWNNVLFWV